MRSAAVGEGYRFAVLGDHDADVEDLVAQVRSLAESERRGGGAARLERPGRRRKPYSVIIDGRSPSWQELGTARESHEGWRFRLVIEDSIEDVRSDAAIIELPVRDDRSGSTSG